MPARNREAQQRQKHSLFECPQAQRARTGVTGEPGAHRAGTAGEGCSMEAVAETDLHQTGRRRGGNTSTFKKSLGSIFLEKKLFLLR